MVLAITLSLELELELQQKTAQTYLVSDVYAMRPRQTSIPTLTIGLELNCLDYR